LINPIKKNRPKSLGFELVKKELFIPFFAVLTKDAQAI